MSLKDILENIVQTNNPILLCAGDKEYEAAALLESLHPVKLKRQAHMQEGMYIASISDGGYLGEVMYRIKSK